MKTALCLSLCLMASCAAPKADSRDAEIDELRDQIAQIQSQFEQQANDGFELTPRIEESPMLEIPTITITPPLRVTPPMSELDQQTIEELKKHYQQVILEQQLKNMLENGLQPAQDGVVGPITPVYETPKVTLEMDGPISGGVKLKMSIPNPIGGPTVHHYELRQISSRWSLVHTGSTEYL